MALDFRLLGPFEVVSDGRALRLGGPRQRAVLALLAIHAGDVVSTDRIADEIWSGKPPQSAVQTIHAYISRLRGVLQESCSSDIAEIVKRQDPGYILRVPRDAIDANRFEEGVARASIHLNVGNAAGAAEELRDALSIWRGGALADLDAAPFAALESQRLEERRVEAIELRIDADLALANHASVIAELQDLVDRYPTRERFWAQLITALYRSRRQAEALAAYRRLRALLVEELGLEPGPELRDLEMQILEQSPALDLTAHWNESANNRTPGREATEFPLPPRLPHLPSIGLVGRIHEHQLLWQAYKPVKSEASSRIVLIAGEAGVGKTTLVSAFVHEAHEQGAIVMYGRCDEDLLLPYGPFVEALAHYLANEKKTATSELRSDHLSALARLAPVLRERYGDLTDATSSDPDAERWLLYGAVVALLESASSDGPVVILLEDLHWADRPTLQLLRHVSAHLSRSVLLVGTYRDTEVSSSDPVAETLVTLSTQPAALGSENRVTRISLSGLEEEEVVSFLSASAGHEMDQTGLDLAHTLHRETGGNPLFVSEVLRHLVETRSIVQESSGRWIQAKDLSEAGLPDSVRQVIRSRVTRLGQGSLQVLSTASALGQEFEAELIASVTRSEEDRVFDVLEAANAAALVSETGVTPGHYRFAHALIQHTLYEGLSATRRARLHRSIAEALEVRVGEEPGSQAGELARHWLLSNRAIDRSKGAVYARIAGDVALDALAPLEAIRWFRQALDVLELLPDDGEKARCLAGLGEAQRQAGDASYRETLLEAARLARTIDDVDVLVRAALANNRGSSSTSGTVDWERIETLETALKALGSAHPAARARLLALLAMERTYDGDYPARKAVADEALTIARRLDDPATLLDVLLRRRLAIRMPETVEALFIESSEAAALAKQVDDPVASFWNAVSRAVYAVQLGDISEVNRSHKELVRLAAQVGQPTLMWDAAWQRGWSTLLAGDLAQAEALADEILQVGTETQQPDALVIYGAHLYAVRWHQGRLGEIADGIIEIADTNPGISPYRAAAAHALAEAGLDEAVRKRLDVEKARGFSAPDDYFLPSYLNAWALVTSEVGDAVAARALYDRLESWPDLVVFSGITVQGAVQHSLGTLATVLGQFDTAEHHFSRARDIHNKLAAPFFRALTELEWGRMLLLQGAARDHERAEPMLRSARDVACQHGYRAVEERAVKELATFA
jgi:DNA-binding SARP family transcriptional activator